MIRRDVRLADGSAGWALISQIEHARISEQLAAHCIGRFSSPQLAEVRREALIAILHHDDGWADWERAPRLDAERRRPISFMELDAPEALEIWAQSIQGAASHGPLAAWMVGGHFCRLIDKSSDSTRADPASAAWRAEMQRRRVEWLAEWQAAEPTTHDLHLAEEALQWLWAFDEASLWLCCTCPSRGEPDGQVTQPYRTGVRTPLELEWAILVPGVARAAPWRFDRPSIDVHAQCRVVPAADYAEPLEMLAASEPHVLHWRLQP